MGATSRVKVGGGACGAAGVIAFRETASSALTSVSHRRGRAVTPGIATRMDAEKSYPTQRSRAQSRVTWLDGSPRLTQDRAACESALCLSSPALALFARGARWR